MRKCRGLRSHQCEHLEAKDPGKETDQEARAANCTRSHPRLNLRDFYYSGSQCVRKVSIQSTQTKCPTSQLGREINNRQNHGIGPWSHSTYLSYLVVKWENSFTTEWGNKWSLICLSFSHQWSHGLHWIDKELPESFTNTTNPTQTLKTFYLRFKHLAISKWPY